MKTCRAFTLVELLVVVAIIAVLAAITVPAVGAFQSKSWQTKSASNMRQIGVALLLYAGEHDGDLPPTSHTTGTKFRRAWIYQLKSYLGHFDEVRLCPADPHKAARRQAEGTSYILNSWVFVPKYGPFGDLEESYNNLKRLPHPGRTVFAFNVSDAVPPGITNDHTHSDLWPQNWQRVCAEIQPDRFRAGRAAADHSEGQSNLLFADGHVEAIEAREMKRRILSGRPFAKPPLEPEELREQP
jgi:prepilin-type N-terminal cleavage/methylation domain-containing protein/prepilin-type processing-associated H-X9-DG protein